MKERKERDVGELGLRVREIFDGMGLSGRWESVGLSKF
jgi:hypothetical protein